MAGEYILLRSAFVVDVLRYNSQSHLNLGRTPWALIAFVFCLGAFALAFYSASPESFGNLGAKHGEEPGSSPPPPLRLADSPEAEILLESLVQRLGLMSPITPALTHLTLQNEHLKIQGQLESLLARSYALTLTESLEGLNRIDNQISIVTPARDDEFIVRDFNRLTEVDAATLPLPITAHAHEGVLTLEGKVPAASLPALLWMAQEVQGVREIQNHLRIAPSWEWAMSDTQIMARVRERLRMDPWTSDGLVFLKASSGAVSLRGFVPDLFQLQRLSELAWVDGVKSVDTSAVHVKTSLGSRGYSDEKLDVLGDDSLRSALLSTYHEDPYLYREMPEVFIRNGDLVLSGEVNSLKAMNSAVLAARTVPGIRRIRNLMSIRIDPTRRDADLAFDLRSRLKLSSALDDSHRIEVVAKDSKIYLEGEVSTLFQSWLATDEASRVPGVLAVENHLHVPTSENPPSDTDVSESFRALVAQSPIFDRDDVLEIYVENGRAYLNGVLDNGIEALLTARIAFESGAREVFSHVMTRTNPWPAQSFNDVSETWDLDALFMNTMRSQRALSVNPELKLAGP